MNLYETDWHAWVQEQAVLLEQGRFDALDVGLATISGELAWLKWMVGTNIVLTLGVLWRLMK